MKPLSSLPAERLTVVAAVLALLAMLMMAVGVVIPKPLPVILAMSVGQLLGIGALLLFLLAVLTEMRSNRRNQEGDEAAAASASDPEAEPHSEPQ